MTAPRRTPSHPVDRLPAQLPPQARSSLARLHSRAWGVATGMMFGLGLFAATMLLVAEGGPNMGQHLSLLSIFLPGYSVSVLGAFIGFVYAFVIGYALGRIVGSVYNATVRNE